MARAEHQALAAVMALGLFTGLWGLTWGLPGQARLRAFHDGKAPAPEVAQSITEHWKQLYEDIKKSHTQLRSEEPVTYVKGVEEIAPGWTFPPDALLNSFRSILLRSESPDEQKVFVVLAQMRPWKLEFKPLYLHYGGAFIYPFGALLKAASLLGAVVLVPDMSRYLADPAAMGRLYLFGRLFILFFHLATLGLLFDMGKRLGGWRAGALAAVFFAFCPFVVVQAHTLKPHPYSAFWCVAAARFMLLAFEKGEARSYWLAGLCAGLAGGSNLSFASFAMLPALAWLLRRAPKGERAAGLGAGALAMLVIALSNPYALFSPKDFLWELTVYPRSQGSATLGGLWALLASAVPAGIGPVLGLVFAFSLGLGLFGRDQRRRMLSVAAALSFFILWLGLARLWEWRGPAALRFFYPVVGLFCVLAGERLAAWKAPRWAKALVVLAVLADSGLRSWIYLENMGLDAGPRATRAQAADWIETNIRPGASVGLLRFPQPATTPVFRYDRYRLVIFERPDLLKAGDHPDYLVVNDQGRSIVEKELKNHYTVVRSYLPVERLWARFIDDSCFANSPMFIYERNGSNG